MSHGRSVIADAGRKSRRRAGEEVAKEIHTYYSGVRAATPLGRSQLQAVDAASTRVKGRSRGPPAEASELTLWLRVACLPSEVSRPREVQDPEQFRSDSELQGEEFEEERSGQDYRNPRAGSAVSEGTYEPRAARKQCKGAHEEGNGREVNVRTRAGDEERPEERFIYRDQGPLSQWKRTGDPNSLGTLGLMTGSKEVCHVSAQAEDVTGERSAAGVEADKTGVIDRSSARAIDVSLEGAAYKWIVGLETRDARPDNWEDRNILVDELARERDPSKKKEKEGGKRDWSKKPKKKNPVRCFNCDEEGHIARSCQKEKKKES
ncbi:hypothetical protein OUZ56_010146 [Daphnia magna]|uniref:CCHC-type domain-containing protein n=1 Tax=Daphnia magna TaxID=35525 RepID=A0ABR0AHY6_9CRUS|nr:hypothetical protein OUZ56_010146 [Daphnia magna]